MNPGDPYRTSGGIACPRCRNVMARESDDELECSNGCGSWLGNKVIETLVPIEVVAKSSGNPFRASPLPPTRCLICKKPLNDLYKGTVDVLTIGQCIEHGVWLERADRAMFEALFRPDIRAHEAEQERQQELAHLDPAIIKLMMRVEALEKQVSVLQQIVEDLRTR